MIATGAASSGSQAPSSLRTNVLCAGRTPISGFQTAVVADIAGVREDLMRRCAGWGSGACIQDSQTASSTCAAFSRGCGWSILGSAKIAGASRSTFAGLSTLAAA